MASGSHEGWVSSSLAALVPGSLGAESSESINKVSSPFPRCLALHRAGMHPLSLSRGQTFIERHRVSDGECEEEQDTVIPSRSPWMIRCESGCFLSCLRKPWAMPYLMEVSGPACGVSRQPVSLCPAEPLASSALPGGPGPHCCSRL